MHKAIRGMSIAAIALMLVAGVTAVQAEPKGPPEGGNRCPCFDAARLAEIEMPFDHCVIHFPSLGQSYYTNIIHGYGDGFAGAQVTFSGPGGAGRSCAACTGWPRDDRSSNGKTGSPPAPRGKDRPSGRGTSHRGCCRAGRPAR